MGALLASTGRGARAGALRIAALALSGACVCACVGGCAPIGPAHPPPPTVLAPQAGWKTLPGSDPALWASARTGAGPDDGAWWSVFADPVLDDLQARLARSSPALGIALARLEQSRATASQHGAALQPSVQAGLAASRSRISADRPLGSYAIRNSETVQNDFRPAISASYEIDWLGRVRRDVEAARADAAQAEADARGVRLLAQAQLAQAYFRLRGLDEQIDLVTRTRDSIARVLGLVRQRHDAGLASQLDLAQQRSLLESTEALLPLLALQRSQQENAIAVLVGEPANGLHVERATLASTPPAIDPRAPASLLERRPDIASAERAMAAANARIGVARAAWFPSLMLGPAVVGTESNALSNLFSAPALLWSLGVGLTQTVYDAGRTGAGVDIARAGYAASVEQYRLAVLTGLAEAENALAGVRDEALARQRQDEATRDAELAFATGEARHREGLDSAIAFSVVEQNLLAARRAQAQVRTDQFLVAVDLVKALGGGWMGDAQPR